MKKNSQKGNRWATRISNPSFKRRGKIGSTNIIPQFSLHLIVDQEIRPACSPTSSTRKTLLKANLAIKAAHFWFVLKTPKSFPQYFSNRLPKAISLSPLRCPCIGQQLLWKWKRKYLSSKSQNQEPPKTIKFKGGIPISSSFMKHYFITIPAIY